MKKTKKQPKKQVKKASKKVQEVRIVVSSHPTLPTVSDLALPMVDGKKMALTKTWVSEDQLIKLVQRTPAQHVYTRPGKGGQRWSYVTGNYVEKVLNFVFGWNWDFEIVEHGVNGDFIWVHGKLTVKSPKGEAITKSQFGRAEIKYMKDKAHTPANMLDFGNDLKSASTDALKKCASLLGIASDIYGKTEYKQETGTEIKETVVVPKEEMTKDMDGELAPACKACGDPISEQEYTFSKKIYGKVLCREHQAEARRNK